MPRVTCQAAVNDPIPGQLHLFNGTIADRTEAPQGWRSEVGAPEATDPRFEWPQTEGSAARHGELRNPVPTLA